VTTERFGLSGFSGLAVHTSISAVTAMVSLTGAYYLHLFVRLFSICHARQGGITCMADFRINVEWDADAEVWVATSLDVPDLVVKGRVPPEIIEVVRLVLPALIEFGVEPEDRSDVILRKNGSWGRAILPIAQNGHKGFDPHRNRPRHQGKSDLGTTPND
jgi:hypothetical protein